MKHPVIRVFDCHVARSNEGSLEFLLLKRAPDRIYAGDWRMVGGKIQQGEAAWEACIRELWEETRLTPTRLIALPYLNRFYEWQQDRINDIPVFVALTAGQDPVLDKEHTEAHWLRPEQAIERLNWPGQVEGLRVAQATLSKATPLLDHLEIDPAMVRRVARPPSS